jgi:transposase
MNDESVWPVWPTLEFEWVNGSVVVDGYPRLRWENAEQYQRRVAYEYTRQYGIKYRDMWIVKKHSEGMSNQQLADSFGISVGTLKYILRKCSVKPRKVVKAIDPARDAEIYRRRYEGETFASIGKHFGVSGGRVRQVFHRFERKVRGSAWRASLTPPKSQIMEPASDILDTWVVSEAWTPEMQAMEIELHRDVNIT